MYGQKVSIGSRIVILTTCSLYPFPVLLGVPDRIRTCGLLLRRQLLYPAELREHMVKNVGRRIYGP